MAQGDLPTRDGVLGGPLSELFGFPFCVQAAWPSVGLGGLDGIGPASVRDRSYGAMSAPQLSLGQLSSVWKVYRAKVVLFLVYKVLSRCK